MDRERWVNFFGTGALVLPLMLGLGTGMIEAFAFPLLFLTMVLLGIVVSSGDDPLGEAKARRDDEPPAP